MGLRGQEESRQKKKFPRDGGNRRRNLGPIARGVKMQKRGEGQEKKKCRMMLVNVRGGKVGGEKKNQVAR